MKTFKFSLVLRTRENTDVFITLDENIYGIHSKRVNILYILNFFGRMFAWTLVHFSLVFHLYCNQSTGSAGGSIVSECRLRKWSWTETYDFFI